MGKDTTLQIKGILILMMLWLHLYRNEDLFDGTCYEFLYWFNGNPFSYHFAKKFCSMCACLHISEWLWFRKGVLQEGFIRSEHGQRQTMLQPICSPMGDNSYIRAYR